MKENLLKFKKAGFDVEVYTQYDENPDTSFIGEYTDELAAGVIVRQFATFYEDLKDERLEELYPRGREYRGFKPYAGGEKVGSKYYKKYGLQDYKRMEGLNRGDWHFLGIIAKVFKKGIELGHASVWGFESDAGQEFFEDEGKSIANEAIAEAKQNLQALCECKEVGS